MLACFAALWSRKPGLELGCRKLSKFRCRRETVCGVLIVPGVLGHGRWPGLGVILTKSEKSKFCDGVCGAPNTDSSPEPPPGVVIIDEGRAIFLGGGVDGGCMRALEAGFAGDGEVARKRRRSAPSSPDLPFLSLPLRPRLPRLRAGGGVRGGEECMLKEWVGRASSSSSDTAAKLFSCMCAAPRKKGKSGPADVVKCGCLRGLIGEDWVSWRWFVQEL